MQLLRLPKEEDLDEYGISFEIFYETFIDNTIKPPVTAKVTINENTIYLGGISIGQEDWFVLIEDE